MNPAGLRATLDVLRQLDAAPADLENLVERLGTDEPAVAVIGLVSRGKSTLVNQVLGQDAAPVAAPPESTALVTYVSGPAAASGVGPSGERRPLPTDMADLAAVLRRSSANDLVSARVQGGFRLPSGVAVIDTPGVGEAAVANDAAFAAVSDRWERSSAGAALVVVSVPPGDSAEDHALIERADGCFGGRIVVALKATSSDVTDQDLDDVASLLEARLPAPMVRVPRSAPDAGWGLDPAWAPLEREIDGLAVAARADLESAIGRLDEVVAATAAGLRATAPGVDELARFERLRDNASPASDPMLLAALDDAITAGHQARIAAADADERRRLEEERAFHDTLERERAARRAESVRAEAEAAVAALHLAIRERHAWQPQDFLTKAHEYFTGSEVRRLDAAVRTRLEAVLSVAAQGGQAAVHEVQRQLQPGSAALALGFQPVRLIGAVGVGDEQLAATRRAGLTVEDLLALLALQPLAPARRFAEESILAALTHRPNRPVAERLIRLSVNPDVRAAATAASGTALDQEAVAAAELTARMLAGPYVSHMERVLASIDGWLKEHSASDHAAVQAAASRLEQRRPALVTRAAEQAAGLVAAELGTLYDHAVVDRGAWNGRRQALLALAERIRSWDGRPTAAAALLDEQVRLARSAGPAWAEASVSAIDQAQAERLGFVSRMNHLLGTAVVVFFVSLLLVAAIPAAWWGLIGSVVGGLMARSKAENPPPWTQWYHHPARPSLPSAERVAAADQSR